MTGVHVGYWEIVVEVIGRTASQVKIVRNTVTHPNKKKIKIKKVRRNFERRRIVPLY